MMWLTTLRTFASCIPAGVVFSITLAVAVESAGQPQADGTSWSDRLKYSEQLMADGYPQEALTALTGLLDEAERAGVSRVSTAAILNNIGSVKHTLGRHPDAEASYVRAIGMLEDARLTRAPTMSRLLDNLASLYMDMGRPYRQVESLRRRAIALRIEEVGPEHPSVGTLLSNLATVCMAQGRYAEARDLLQRALPMVTSGADTAGVLQNLAVLAGNLEMYPEAVEHISRAITALENALGADHPELVIPLLNLARLQVATKRPAAAEAVLARALKISEAKLDTEHPVVAETLRTLADVLQRTGRKSQAKALRQRAEAIAEQHPLSPAAEHSVHVSELAERNRRNQQDRLKAPK